MNTKVEIVAIGMEQLKLLKIFVEELGVAEAKFRYFSSRPLSVISNHMITLLGLDSRNEPLAYGHLDVEDGVVWLGVCVLPRYWGQGLGSSIVQRLLQEAIELQVEQVMLSVDNDNAPAISLYTKQGFKLTVQRGGTSFFVWKHYVG